MKITTFNFGNKKKTKRRPDTKTLQLNIGHDIFLDISHNVTSGCLTIILGTMTSIQIEPIEIIVFGAHGQALFLELVEIMEFILEKSSFNLIRLVRW